MSYFLHTRTASRLHTIMSAITVMFVTQSKLVHFSNLGVYRIEVAPAYRRAVRLITNGASGISYYCHLRERV